MIAAIGIRRCDGFRKRVPSWVRIGAKIVLGRIRPLGCPLYRTNRQVMELSIRASWLASATAATFAPRLACTAKAQRESRSVLPSAWRSTVGGPWMRGA